jgi:hypothetical protein
MEISHPHKAARGGEGGRTLVQLEATPSRSWGVLNLAVPSGITTERPIERRVIERRLPGRRELPGTHLLLYAPRGTWRGAEVLNNDEPNLD